MSFVVVVFPQKRPHLITQDDYKQNGGQLTRHNGMMQWHVLQLDYTCGTLCQN